MHQIFNNETVICVKYSIVALINLLNKIINFNVLSSMICTGPTCNITILISLRSSTALFLKLLRPVKHVSLSHMTIIHLGWKVIFNVEKAS